MNVSRDEHLLKMRPQIPSINLAKNLSAAESFQNATLRPILKFQDELIQIVFKTNRNHLQLDSLSIADQRHRITKILESNSLLRNQLIGLIIGLMTVKECENYLEMESEMKRRIKTMLVERLILQ